MRGFRGGTLGTPETRGSSHPTPMAQAVVPFLGAILTELVMLDAAMEDYLEVGEPGGRAGVTRIGAREERAPLLSPEWSEHGNFLS